MCTRRRHVVARWKFFDDLDVGDEPGPRVGSLEQIVAQQGAVRHPARKRAFEGVQIVDPLAGVRALPKQILVYVRHG